MKKLLSFVAVTVAMVASLSGNAMAYFEDLKLIRVVYEKQGNTEVATDLGNVNDILSQTSKLVKVGGGADAFTNFFGGANTDFSNLNVAYFAIDKSAAADLWISGGANVTLSGGKWLTVKSNVGGVQTNYTGLAVQPGTATVVGTKTATGSYYAKLDGSGTKVGLLSGLLLDGTNMGTNLAALANNAYVQQNFFKFDNFGTTGQKIAGAKILDANGKDYVSIRTLADGSTVVTPIPASLLLFGSGLLGLFGIRRKAA